MRVGTWNLEGRWGQPHQRLLQQQNCDIWLLTEVPADINLDGYQHHLAAGLMAPVRHWAGVLSRAALGGLPDPHPASAAANVAGRTYCSSILPWRSCGTGAPWRGTTHADKLAATLSDLRRNLPGNGELVWGGDFNQALIGPETAGSVAGRDHLLAALRRFRLQAPTSGLRHQREGAATIDHIGVPHAWDVTRVERVPAPTLSDHDAYIVETAD